MFTIFKLLIFYTWKVNVVPGNEVLIKYSVASTMALNTRYTQTVIHTKIEK